MTDYYKYPCIGYTGGGDGALDAIDGSLLKDGDAAHVSVPSTTINSWHILDADSGIDESSPDVIAPDSNAGDKRWILSRIGFQSVPALPVTCGQVSNMGDADPFPGCHYIPKNGNKILIDGKIETIPEGVLSVSGGVVADYADCSIDKTVAQTLTAETLYYIYLYMLAGTMTIDFSETSWEYDSDYGIAVKQGDAACTLVGVCYPKQTKTYTITAGGASYTPGRYWGLDLTGGTGTGMTADITVNGSGAVSVVSLVELGVDYTDADELSFNNAYTGGVGSGFKIELADCAITTYGGARGQTISSYYNRFVGRLETGISVGAGTVNDSDSICDDGLTCLSNGERQYNFLEWVQWYDQAPLVKAYACIGNGGVGDYVYFAVSTSDGAGDGTDISGMTAQAIIPAADDGSVCLTTENDPHDSTGYYRAWAKCWGTTGTTTTIATGYMFANGITV